MAEIYDGRRICIIDGCKNLGEWDSVKNFKLYRKKYCSSHRAKLGLKNKKFRKVFTFQQKYKLRDLCSSCMVCGWVGPCDCHRIEHGGSYNLDNVASICPNCHRLIHRGMLDIIKLKEKFIKLNKEHLSK